MRFESVDRSIAGISMWQRLETWAERLERPRVLLLVAALALILTMPVVGSQLALDDYVLAAAARNAPRIAGFVQGTLNLFTFTTGQPADNLELMNQGFLLPWWTEPALKISFYRPLSSLTHHLDFALWPDSARAMYAHSIVWFGAALLAVLALYRKLESSPRIAGIAFALYALDDAHAPAVAWLSNRNALIATAFGVLALLFHDRAQRGGQRVAILLSPAALLAGLFAGEFAIGVVAYLVAYALFLDSRPALQRVLGLLPHLVVLGLWRAFYTRMGFGSRGSGAYVDPVGEPLLFLKALPQKLSVLVAASTGGPPSDLAFFAPPEHRPWLTLLAALALALASFLFLPSIRRDPVARFWGTGALAAAVPVSASFPSDRLLFFVGLGTMALFARVFDALLAAGVRSAPFGPREKLAVLFAGLHCLAAPALLPLRATQMQMVGGALERANDSLPLSGVSSQTLVILAAPVDILASYVQAERAVRGQERPRHLHWLASATSEVKVSRPSERALVVEPSEGYLFTPLERHYRGAFQSLGVGSQIKLEQMDAEVLSLTTDGRPAKVRFTFDEPLESSKYAFARWHRDRYVSVPPPMLGSELLLPREDFGKIVLAANAAPPL